MDAKIDDRIEAPKLRKRERTKVLRRVLMLGGVAVVAVGGLLFWLFGGRYVSTDDAYIEANKLMVSTDVSGLVQEVDVHEGQMVKKGDVLFRLDPRPFQIALAQAQSQMATSALTIQSMEQDYKRMLRDIDAQRAQADLARTNFARQNGLIKIGGTAQMNVDQAKATVATSESQVGSLQLQAEVQLAKLGGRIDLPLDRHPEYMQAEAARDEAQRQLDHTVVRAPFDGVVTQVASLQPGAMIVSSLAAFMPTSAVGLVSNQNIWVQADLKETDLTFVRPGLPVEVTVDSYPGRKWRGTVTAIAPATGAQFSVLPSENAGGNWVKVVQRLSVKIGFNPDEDITPLRAGMSVTADIDTGHTRKLSDLF